MSRAARHCRRCRGLCPWRNRQVNVAGRATGDGGTVSKRFRHATDDLWHALPRATGCPRSAPPVSGRPDAAHPGRADPHRSRRVGDRRRGVDHGRRGVDHGRWGRVDDRGCHDDRGRRNLAAGTAPTPAATPPGVCRGGDSQRQHCCGGHCSRADGAEQGGAGGHGHNKTLIFGASILVREYGATMAVLYHTVASLANHAALPEVVRPVALPVRPGHHRCTWAEPPPVAACD